MGERRSVYLIAWDVIHKQKEGGLGFCRARDMNLSFLMKLAWGLIDRPQSLWLRFMKNKYVVQWRAFQ